MTTIATDGITIAADTQTSRGHERAPWREEKITVRDGVIFSNCGNANVKEALIAWYRNGCDPEKAPKCGSDEHWSLFAINGDGMFVYDKDSPYPLKIMPPYTMGSGRDFAMGALYAGLSSEEAVRIACKLDVWSGGEIQVVNIAQALGLNAVKEAAE